MIVELNINDIVSVKLTPDGEGVLHGQKGHMPIEHHPLADGSYRLPLWKLMGIFGPSMDVGTPMLFVRNKITLISL